FESAARAAVCRRRSSGAARTGGARARGERVLARCHGFVLRGVDRALFARCWRQEVAMIPVATRSGLLQRSEASTRADAQAAALPDILYIMGTGRSGTTILEVLIASSA